MSKAIAVIASAGVAALFAAELPKLPVIVWNASPSVPIGLYSIERRPLRRGDLALIRLPRKIADWSAERGYLPRSAYLIKPVAAIAGDRVCRIGRIVLVRGSRAATAASRDAAGRTMLHWRGCRVLGFGALFVVSPRPDGFDSRYFGAVICQDVVGAASPIWLF